jgi:hypothetical protein
MKELPNDTESAVHANAKQHTLQRLTKVLEKSRLPKTRSIGRSSQKAGSAMPFESTR